MIFSFQSLPNSSGRSRYRHKARVWKLRIRKNHFFICIFMQFNTIYIYIHVLFYIKQISKFTLSHYHGCPTPPLSGPRNTFLQQNGKNWCYIHEIWRNFIKISKFVKFHGKLTVGSKMIRFDAFFRCTLDGGVGQPCA